MPRWRNGIRSGLKNLWEQSREGSSPSLGTKKPVDMTGFQTEMDSSVLLEVDPDKEDCGDNQSAEVPAAPCDGQGDRANNCGKKGND